MKKFLVTGATGFIGPYVIDDLLRGGHTVIASSSSEDKARTQPWFGAVKYVPFDLKTVSSKENYYEYFGRPDAMIHLAWEGLPNYKASFHLDDNLPRHQLLLENLVRGGLTDLTVTGTCLEYGMQEGALTEDMPARPGNPYAVAKDKLRLYLEKLRSTKHYSLKWVRLFYMYGKGQNPNSLFSQLDRALASHEPVFNMSGGEQIRDFLPVEKMAQYLAAIAGQQVVEGIINCCSGQQETVRKMVENYLSRRHQSISLNLGYYPYPDYEPFRFWGDTAKLKTVVSNE